MPRDAQNSNRSGACGRGSTIDEIAGAPKKKLELDVTPEKDEKRRRIYRIA
jgi:hypothetical protein